MGKIRDFLAKWQSIERPEWDMEEIESKSKIRYEKKITDEEKEWVIKKEEVDKEDAGNILSVLYDEIDEEGHSVYAVFEDSETQEKVHYEEFDHRKAAKDRLEELLDEYSEIEHRIN